METIVGEYDLLNFSKDNSWEGIDGMAQYHKRFSIDL